MNLRSCKACMFAESAVRGERRVNIGWVYSLGRVVIGARSYYDTCAVWPPRSDDVGKSLRTFSARRMNSNRWWTDIQTETRLPLTSFPSFAFLDRSKSNSALYRRYKTSSRHSELLTFCRCMRE